MDELRKLVERAMNRAFSMGQKYWADADSESYSANARAEKTAAAFDAMRDETLAALAAIPVGWVLVPREATKDMEAAAVHSAVNHAQGKPWFPFAWRAAIAASPPLAASRAQQEPQP